MSKKLIALSVTVATITAFMLFSVFNAFALEFGLSGGSGMTSAVKLCKVARKTYRRDIKDARAKGLSLQLSRKEISDMVREIKTYRNKICKEAKKKRSMPEASTSTGPKTLDVSINNFAFLQNSLTIKKGDTVKFTNNEDVPHQVASDPHPAHTSFPSLNGGILNQGGTFEVAFDTAGTFTYHCQLHPSMQGTITVME